MKRLWIGAGLLAAVLVLSLWASGAMERTHRTAALDLERAGALAAEGNWQGARELAGRAETLWQRQRPITASLADHAPMDETEGLFAQLEVYEAMHDPVSFGAACARLATLLEAIADAHQLTLPNFF